MGAFRRNKYLVENELKEVTFKIRSVMWWYVDEKETKMSKKRHENATFEILKKMFWLDESSR